MDRAIGNTTGRGYTENSTHPCDDMAMPSGPSHIWQEACAHCAPGGTRPQSSVKQEPYQSLTSRDCEAQPHSRNPALSKERNGRDRIEEEARYAPCVWTTLAPTLPAKSAHEMHNCSIAGARDWAPTHARPCTELGESRSPNSSAFCPC